MTISVRNATLQDINAVYELICELESSEFPKDLFTEAYNKNLNDSGIGYFVAQLDSGIAGFGSVYINTLLHHCGKIAEIQELVVTKSYRGKNIGKVLLSEMVAWAKQQGALQVEVTSNMSRTDALEFYKKNGFLHTHHKLVLKRE